ncbi:photoreceptor cilium actin regulator-like [Carcharodon carcharias]|uniref:photoreceptor cilium actin regulator-like n=1 Tax=Carcharodon carcharias TaxID=13397 RepID=UPI001B7DF4B4|nr:photoreceptor cilium actin regulator-like [Carcharodon carcharias]
MGCAPSQSEIIQHLAKNTLRPLKKAAAQAPADKAHADSRTCSTSGGSGSSDSEANSSEDGREGASPPGGKGERRGVDAGRGRNLAPPAVPAHTPQLYNEERKREKLAAGAQVAVSEVIVSRKYVSRELPDRHTSSEGGVAQPSKRGRKQKGHHVTQQAKGSKLRENTAEDEEKVDFPASLVDAHQAAYAYLTPSLSKYDAVLCLIDQAAQTQLTLQQMVSFLTLRFDEANQALGEIASEGERLVKEVGPHLAWPPEKGAPKERPDLLQQLLQYTVNKLQATNGAVTGLTATALQEACCYLQSATDALGKRLAVKQETDERLRRMIAQLEACALQQSRTKPGDMALHSEDSGIGADTDSMKGDCQPGKCGRRVSSDSNAHLLCRDSLPPRKASLSHVVISPSKPQARGLDHQCKGVFYSSHEEKASSSQPSAPVNTSRSSLTHNRSFDSYGSATSTDCEALIRTESMDFCSLGEEDDEESESEMAVDGSPQAPRSPPPGSKAARPVPKRIDVPENEEMSIKIKDAISDKIQFVPIAPGSNIWSDEEGKPRPARPSTAKGCRTRVAKKRRSESAGSLKGKAEDPTLLELQRTQKDLNRRLQRMLQPKGEDEGGMGQQKVAAMPKLPVTLPNADQAVPSNKLKASLHNNFSILPSQEKVLLRRSPARLSNQGQAQGQAQAKAHAKAKTQAETQAQAKTQDQARTTPSSNKHDPAKAKENQASPKRGAARLKRNGVRGLINSFSGAHGVPTAGESGGAGRLGSPPLAPLPQPESEMDPGDFPPPPAELELATDALTAGLAPRDACSVAGATDGASAARGAALSRVTVTQRLLASLDSVPLLPSKQPGGRARGGHSARSPWRPQAGAATAGEQPWPPYKIINLRYSGGCCSSPENGSTDRLPEHSSPGPVAGRGAEAEGTSELLGSNSALSKEAPGKLTTPPRGRKLAASAASPCPSHQATGGPAPPAPTSPPPALRKSFPSPPLPQRNLCQPAGYTAPSPSPARRNCPNRAWGSKQPNPPAAQEELNPLASSKRSSPPPVPRKLRSPLSLCQLPHPTVNCQPPSPPTQHQLPSPPTHRQLPSSPTHRQLPSPPTHRQLPSSPTHRQPPSPPTQHQLPSPPTHRQLPSPQTHRQLPSPPTHRQLPSPPTHRQLPSSPTHRQLPSPPTHRQLPSPPTTINVTPPVVSVRKRPPDHPEAARQSHCPGKPGSNASSIFCPLSHSIFESQPSSPPVGAVNAAAQLQNIILGDGSPMTSRAAWRNNFMLRQPGDRQRRLTLSGVHAQPFVKKNHHPDFKTGAQNRFLASSSAGSEPTLYSIGLNGSFESEDDSWMRHFVSEVRGSNRSVSHPELCIIGQGLQ